MDRTVFGMNGKNCVYFVLIIISFGAYAAAKDARIACYYSNWAIYRPSLGRYSTLDIPEDQCTHVIYAFIGVNNDSWSVQIKNPKPDIEQNGFLNFTGLKQKFPEQFHHVALGGWGEGGYKLSQMVSEKERRDDFIKSIVDFMKKYKFEGISIDWEYPAFPDRDGIPSNKKDFLSFVKELRAMFDSKRKNWEITIEGSPEESQIDEGYHVPELCGVVDAVYVKSFDLRGYWTGFVDVHSPLFRRPHDGPDYRNLNVADVMQLWLDKGCPADKLIVGIPTFGRTYTLARVGSGLGAPVRGIDAGKEGSYTRSYGYSAYYEICSEALRPNSGWTKEWDDNGKCPYVYKDDQWIGYEDVESIGHKIDWLKTKGFGGAMVFALDMDDFNGLCGIVNPLLNKVRASLFDYRVPTVQ